MTTTHASGAAIQRYKICYHSYEWGPRSITTTSGIPDASGSWVCYADHIAALAAGQATAAQAQPVPENIRVILTRCRDFIDTTKVPAYPSGADLSNEIDVLLAAQPAPQPPHVAPAAVPADLITIRKPTTSAEMLWLLKLAHLVISDMDKTLEKTFAPAQPAAQHGVAYAALPEPYCNAHDDAGACYPDMFSAQQMRAFADATHTLRASHGQAPAGAGEAAEHYRNAIARARLLDSDLPNLTERGAKAWAGVDAQGLRDGSASPSANAGEPSAHIKEPYTLAEIKAKIASNDYSAEMLLQHAMLQHAMLLLDSASLSANAGEPRNAIDRDALIDAIAQGLHGTWHCTRVWEAWHVGTMSQDDFEPVDESETPTEIADAVLALLAAPPAAQAEGWISVDERLPEKNTEVLICFAELSIPSTGRYTASALDHEGWCYPQENHLWPGERPDFEDGGSPTVTHWMPLPAAPGPADGESNG